ncbi:MAG: ATP-binding protein [Propionibacteriaceae bacterium]|jgi:NadR type nicotinamide-nucleotide adenylyltransferase|nr:ATP-binding protein [Propionibacteriaceae bacterium]
MKHAVVALTGVVPTRGEADLVEFAAALPGTQVWVVVGARAGEPILIADKLAALREQWTGTSHVRFRAAAITNGPAPDGGDWAWWATTINRGCPEAGERWDYVVAPQAAGQPLAAALGARLITMTGGPHPVTDRDVRADPWRHWADILPAIRRSRLTTITLFGQESVGKTTLAARVAGELGAGWLPEWARLFLDQVGTTINPQVMAAIAAGQTAWQVTARHRAAHPVLLQDTDLYSSLGYFQLLDVPLPPHLADDAARLASDLYIVLPDDIPFVPDAQRYGGDVRETPLAYWTRLLDAAGQPYVVAPAGDADTKAAYITGWARSLFADRWREIREGRVAATAAPLG